MGHQPEWGDLKNIYKTYQMEWIAPNRSGRIHRSWYKPRDIELAPSIVRPAHRDLIVHCCNGGWVNFTLVMGDESILPLFFSVASLSLQG